MKDRILNALMLAAVAAALGLSLLRGGGETEALPLAVMTTVAPVQTPHPADAYRAERNKTRQREETLLKALIEGVETAPEIRELAQAQLLQTVEIDETELAVEAALAAAGRGQGLCVARQGEITVFFPREITAREAALFLAVVQDASGLPADNIRLTGS